MSILYYIASKIFGEFKQEYNKNLNEILINSFISTNNPKKNLIDKNGLIINNISKIKIVQYKLNELGYKLNINGVWNECCYNNLLKFQQDNNLIEDGTLNLQTENCLNLG